jgi:hypothetical protein
LHLFDSRINKECRHCHKRRDIGDDVLRLLYADRTRTRRIKNETDGISTGINNGICIFWAGDTTDFNSSALHDQLLIDSGTHHNKCSGAFGANQREELGINYNPF